MLKMVVYCEPVTVPVLRAGPGIVNRRPAINNKLATKSTPKPKSTQTLNLSF